MLRDFIRPSGIKPRLTLVRYNTFGERTGIEASDESYANALAVIGGALDATKSKIVSRVGMDVAASCGMFDAAAGV